ncbi:hypothetical protein ACIBHX_21460 [Nonomuraea sp. NPDC050536]|uniref:hypothetical protein n=1 Tax=Nonomuraea sp. NPDC050536 TaxID=3364366 RepID=UPI0037C56A95
MNFCLSDLVPPLRWSDASKITLLTGQPDLPEAWWRSLPMPRVLAAIGPESLGELLTEIALEHWPAAAVGDVLPALHVLDPDDADEPHVAIALDRAGSWTGLLALTSRELADQPFIQARPVLTTLFSAVLVRLASPAPAPHAASPAKSAAEAPVTKDPTEQSVAGEPASPTEAVKEPTAKDATASPLEAAEHEEPVADEQVAEQPAEEPVADEPAAAAADAVELAEAQAEADEPVQAQASAVQPAEAQAEADEPAAAEADELAEAQALELAEADEPAQAQAGAVQPAEAQAEADEPAEAQAADAEPAEAQHEADEPAEAHAEAPEAEAAELAEVHAEAAEFAEEPAADAELAEAVEDAEDAEPEGEGGLLAAAPSAEAGAELDEEAAPSEAEPEPAAAGEPVELADLIEAAFAGLDDKSWAVAQNRVFTDEPSAVDQLAKLFAVPPAEIDQTETQLRAKLDQWLASDEAAPYRAHLDELRRTIGPAAPKERLIRAADWHRKEIRALEVPAWQFVLATMPEQRQAAQEAPQPVQAQGQQAPQAEALQAQAPQADGPREQEPQFHAFTPVAPAQGNGVAEEPPKPYQPLKDVAHTRRCFRQPDGRWWLRIDVTAEQLTGGECALPTGFAAYLDLSPGESRTVRSAAGELTMTWHGRPVLENVERLLADVGAKEGGHLFLTLSDEGVLRARHLPVAAAGAEKITKALRLVGYTAPGGTKDQAARVIATRIGMTGPVGLPDLLTRLRERGDRDLLQLLD